MNKWRIPLLLASCHALAFTLGTEGKASADSAIVAKAPTFAAWTVTSTPDNADGSADASLKSPVRRLRTEIEVQKTDKTRHEHWLWDNGQVTEVWYVGKYSISQEPDSKDIYVFSAGRFSSSGPLVPDYTQSDFPELSWVSAGDYVGEVTFHGHKCHYFEAKAQNASGSFPKKAWVDEATKLPVGYDDGKNQALYVFHDAGNPAPMPEPFTKALRDYEASEDQSKDAMKVR